jgi:transcriptional regulator with XRE-family HTH domain
MTLGVGSDTQRRGVLAVGDRVRRLRVRAGLSVDELAAAAGRPAGFCRDVEAGRAALTYLDLLDLAGALGASPATLLADEAPAPPRPRPPDRP